LVTFRSRYSLEQFRHVLQPVAHNIALKAVQKLNGRVAIKALEGQLLYVETENFSIRFNKRTLTYWDFKRKLFFQIEEHPYTDGNMVRIVCQGKGKAVKRKAEKFIANLMKGVKPESVFSLEKFTRKS